VAWVQSQNIHNVRFVVDEAALRQVIITVLQLPCQCHSTNILCSFTYHRNYIIVATDMVVN